MTFATAPNTADAWAWSVEYVDGRTATEAALGTFHNVGDGVAAVILTHQYGGPVYRLSVHPDHRPVFIRRRSITLPGPSYATRTIVGWGTDGIGQFMVLDDQGRIRHVNRLELA